MKTTKQKRKKRIIGLVLLLVSLCMVIGVCGLLAPDDGEPVSAPIATATLEPTSTLTPILTHTPIPTLEPTSTNVPIPPTTVPTSIPVSPTESPVCDCSGDIYNCPDFTTHAQAQACHNYCMEQGQGDIHELDADDNGLACESGW